ncbi:MAG: DUF559 domain-containing protein [Armatimonadetes bacterium]|nr:DUF559 domain-containing protein [Armatimonadota bacterium]
MSESQKRLWYEVRAGRIGFKIKREVPLGVFTLDFYCHEALLCIEVDGEQHDPDKDRERDAALRDLGVETVRFSSIECFEEPESVAKHVLEICIQRSGRDPFREQDAPSP